jgi:hypothetical protein
MAKNEKLSAVVQSIKRGSSQKDFITRLFAALTLRIAPRYPVTTSMFSKGNPPEESYPAPSHLVMLLYWKDDTGRHLRVEIALHLMKAEVKVIETDDRSWDLGAEFYDLTKKPENEFIFHVDHLTMGYHKPNESIKFEPGDDMDKMVIYIQDILVRWSRTEDSRRP